MINAINVNGDVSGNVRIGNSDLDANVGGNIEVYGNINGYVGVRYGVGKYISAGNIGEYIKVGGNVGGYINITGDVS